MAPGREVVPTTRALLHLANGEVDRAKHILKIHGPFAKPSSISAYLLREIAWRLTAFYGDLSPAIQRGVKLHDAKQYKAAIALYDGIVRSYPGSALARYERYFSRRVLIAQKAKRDRPSFADWDKVSPSIYAADPLFSSQASSKMAGWPIKASAEWSYEVCSVISGNSCATS